MNGYRGKECTVMLDGVWHTAQFVSVDLIGLEPIVQVEKSMPVFATWGSVRGISREDVLMVK